MEQLAHYPCVSEKDPSMIDFFPSVEKAQKGQSQSMKPGKYLKAFYGDILTETDIKVWSDKHKELHANAPELKWAKTPDEIEEVYSMDAGFQSCMQHRRSHWSHGKHPVRAYGAGDLAIAYIERDNFLMARALVWPEKKKVGRVYGEGAMLRNALKRAGIPTESTNSVYDSMEGAKLLFVPIPSKRRGDSLGVPAVLPYIDSRDDTVGLVPEGGQEEHPDALRVVKSAYGKFLAVDQGGVIYPTRKCQSCGTKYNANRRVVNRPGYVGAYGTQELYQEYCCVECGGDDTNYFHDAATSLRLSREHYTPVYFFQYAYDSHNNPRRSQPVLAKEVIASFPQYFISDHSGHAFRSNEKWVTPDGKNITTHERDCYYKMSTYNGKYYLATEMELLNGRYFTKTQKPAILASKFDLFIRDPEPEIQNIAGNTGNTGAIIAS